MEGGERTWERCEQTCSFFSMRLACIVSQRIDLLLGWSRGCSPRAKGSVSAALVQENKTAVDDKG